jgi:hypothetical protein
VLRRAIHTGTYPLSALSDPLVHIGHNTHDGDSARAGQTLQHASPRWSRALGRGTYGGRVVGQDGQGLLRTLQRQVRRLCSSCRFSKPSARTHATPHRYTASTARRMDTLECICCSEGGSALRVRGVSCQSPVVSKPYRSLYVACVEPASFCQAVQKSRWESHQCTALPKCTLHPYFLHTFFSRKHPARAEPHRSRDRGWDRRPVSQARCEPVSKRGSIGRQHLFILCTVLLPYACVNTRS